MSLSNPAYGILPAFQRPASTGPSPGGGFNPPPPGASQGGEPSQHPFQQSYPSQWPNQQPYQSQSQTQPIYTPWAYAQSQQSHRSQPQNQQSQQMPQTQYQIQRSHTSPYIPHLQPTQHSPYPAYRQPLGQLQSQNPQQSDPSSVQRWTYGQYPPSPDFPPPAPATTSAVNTPNIPSAAPARYSPYGASLGYPPASDPLEAAPWSQHFHAQQPNPQPHQHSTHLSQQYPSNLQRSHRHRQDSSSSGHMHYPEEAPRYTAPLPFRGSANAPAPKKSALRRSNSQSGTDRPVASGSQSHTPQMQRAGSTGSGFGHGGSSWPPVFPGAQNPQAPPVMPMMPSSNAPGYTLGDEDQYSSENLSPRPRDWRADYSSKQGFSSYLQKIGRVRTDVEEYIDTIKRSMHPLLHHTPNTTPLAFDLRYKLIDGNTLLFHQLGRHFHEVDLAQLAAYPPAPMLRLYHSRLPWYIDVHQSHTSGVTVFDVLVQMSLQMQAPIHNRHYYNDALDSEDRAALGKSYKERTRGRPGEGRKGILQVDFLREKHIFEGLIRGRQGMWEIKTRRPDA